MQAALASALSFAAGAALPLVIALFAPLRFVMPPIGGLAAQAGGARIAPGALRVMIWGIFAMLVTSG